MEQESFGIIPLWSDPLGWRVLLILHKNGGHWGFPKGHKEAGETPLSAAERELKEETGLQVESLLLSSPLVEKYTFERGGEVIYKTVSYFPALVQGVLRLQEAEVSSAKWVSLESASLELTYKEAQAICQKLREHLNV